MNYRETEIQEALAYKERAVKEAAIPGERLKAKAILEQSDRENYYARRYANDEAAAAYGRFKQEVTDTLVAETVYCLAASCTDSMILENGYNKDLLRVLSTNFVNENGSQNLLRKWRGTSYIMSEFAYIIQNNIDSICEKADPKNQATLKIKDDQKKKFFKDIDKVNADSAITAIRTKVKSATAEFIDSNNAAKEQIKSILDSTKKKIEKNEKDENLKEAYAAQAKRKITDIRASKTKGVFEAMVYSVSESAFKNEDAKKIFIEDANLNMDTVVEHCEVMYTFLETLNTLKLVKIDEAYIEKLIADLKEG